MGRKIAVAIGSTRPCADEHARGPRTWRVSTRFTFLVGAGFVAGLACCLLAGGPAWAIDCLSAPGDPKTGWYSWREIDGRKCWFKKSGAMPAKSQLHWVAKAEEGRRPGPVSPPVERMPPAAPPMAAEPPVVAPVATAQPEGSRQSAVPQFRTVRVRPVAGVPRMGSDQVDLMSGGSLSAVQVFGGGRKRTGYPAAADPFDARFSGKGN